MNHIKYISILLLFFTYLNSFGQRSYETNPDSKRANIWYFGQNAGINFNTNPPTALTDGKVNTWEGCSSICDTSGKLLFYTDGRTVWNKNHDTIENGYGLLGGISSTQAAVIVNHKFNDSIYYIFTTPNASQTNIGLNLSILNSRSNNGNGKILYKNIKILLASCEKMCVTNHINGNDIWILGHEWNSNFFFSYLVTSQGINTSCPVLSSTGGNLKLQFGSLNATGQMKFSNNGNMVVNTFVMNKQTELFRFNKSNGKVEYWKSFIHKRQPYGIEFSPNDSLLYITEQANDSNFFYQYNIFNNSKYLLSKYKFRDIQALQASIDKKIFVAENDSFNIGVVHMPNIVGYACNYSKTKFYFNPSKSSYGLPNFNQSYFYTPSINFKYHLNCLSNTITFNGLDTFSANTYTWQIGKTNKPLEATYNTKNITHTFIDTGIYNICYVAQNGLRLDTITKTITLYPKIYKNFLGKDTTYFTGDIINKTLRAPYGMHCQIWQDSSGLSAYTATKKGVYTCKITNQSFCEAIDTLEIKECLNLTAPTIYRKSTDSLFCKLNLVDTFIWYRNNVPFKMTYSDVTNESNIKLTDTGAYRVEGIKYGYCNKSSTTFYVNKLSVINILKQNILIYPNPSNGNLKIENKLINAVNYTLTNTLGQTLQIGTIINGINSLDFNYSKGVYVLTITHNNQTIKQKLIIQ